LTKKGKLSHPACRTQEAPLIQTKNAADSAQASRRISKAFPARTFCRALSFAAPRYRKETFYAPVSYVEPADRLDNSELVLGRDYSGQYEGPIWRDDA
jgi:hypothetical protein